MSSELLSNDSLDLVLSRHFEQWSFTAPLNYQLVRNMEEFRAVAVASEENMKYRSQLERVWLSLLQNREFVSIPGLCRVCQRATNFRLDLLYGDGTHPNWRERMVCEHCNLNNRLRLCADVFEGLNVCKTDSDVYITEQVTTLFELLKTRCHLTGSEYLGPDVPLGSVVNGLRHEDATSLSFVDGQFDQLLSFDVLEHIPDAQKALREMARVLRQHGTLLLTAPFDVSARKNLQRASVNIAGEITHIHTAEYHGDPINPSKGVLCYWWFGWELLDQLHDVGFSDAAVFTCWSAESGYLGPASPVIVAQR